MNIFKNLSTVAAGAVFVALGTVGRVQAVSLDSTITLGFEGVGDQNTVVNFYNTAPQDFDVVFSPNSLSLVDRDAGGNGNFANEPSPETVLFFLEGSAATLNTPNGFDTGFSFYYSASYVPGSIKVYDGLDATGNVLATLDLPVTPIGPGDPQGGTGDPDGQYSTFSPIGVAFTGTARSIDFGGTANQIAFDNVTFNSATPGTVPTTPDLVPTIPGSVPTSPTEIPFEFSPSLGILLLGAWGAISQLNGFVQKRKSSAPVFSKD